MPLSNEGNVASLKTMAVIVAGMLLLAGLFVGPPLLKLVCALVVVFGAKFAFDAVKKQG